MKRTGRYACVCQKGEVKEYVEIVTKEREVEPVRINLGILSLVSFPPM